MAKYRFKTKEEFIRDGQWSSYSQCPEYWNSEHMNKFLGTDIPEEFNRYCDSNSGFNMRDGVHNWSYNANEYVLKTEIEIKSGFVIEKVKEFKM